MGKTETVKGLAFFLGRYLALFGCSPHSDPAALGKVVQGLAMVRSAKINIVLLIALKFLLLHKNVDVQLIHGVYRMEDYLYDACYM